MSEKVNWKSLSLALMVVGLAYSGGLVQGMVGNDSSLEFFARIVAVILCVTSGLLVIFNWPEAPK